MSRIPIGIIGCGGMAKTHASRFAGLEERIAVTAAVDVEKEQAEQLAALFPDAVAALDYRTVLDRVDAVLVAVPHHLHHPVAIDCLNAGKHVLIEKPLANSEPECLDLIATAEKVGRTLMVAYCMRFDPCVAMMKELLDARTYGDCFQLSIWTEQLTRRETGHWYNRAATLGGGQLFSHGCHYIDLLMWYLGRPESGVHVGTNLGTPWMEREGTSNVTMRFESGALGYHFGSWGARGTRLSYSFHAHCEQGMLEFRLKSDRFDGEELIFHAGGEEEVLFQAERSKPTRDEMVHFLDCIESGAVPLTNPVDSLEGLRVIWRLYEAEQRGAVADLRGLGLQST